MSRAPENETDNEEPTAKRPRLGTDEEEDDDLEDLLEGDAFLTQEERERRAAERRRQERQRRLQQLHRQQPDDTAPKNVPAVDDRKPPPSQQMKNGVKDDDKSTMLQNKKRSSPAAPANAMETQTATKHNEEASDDDDDDDGFDMFSSSVSPTDGPATTTTQQRGVEQQDWDDAEGYYKAVIGESIHLDPTPPSSATSNSSNNNAQAAAVATGSSITFRVSGVIGKGVFSTVLKCTTVSNSSSVELPPVTALKFIRHNETMTRAALTEMEILQRLKGSPGIVPMLLPTTQTPLEHRGHTILVFSFMDYNLRDVLLKFGKGVGLSLQAVRSYFGQLLAAATHLQKHGIIHADLKPDNILVSADFAVVQLADFGSALDHVHAPEVTTAPAPYLVSRFYRAPELILGLVPVTPAIDLWSLAVTVAELFLGDVLFRGTSNNDMLYVIQQHLGAFSNRVIRQHLVQCQKSLVPAHFQQTQQGGASYCFTQRTVDPVTGAAQHKELSLVQHSSSSRQQQQHGQVSLGDPSPQQVVEGQVGERCATHGAALFRFAQAMSRPGSDATDCAQGGPAARVFSTAGGHHR